MTWLLALSGAALCGAAIPQNSALVYLWIPGLFLLVVAFARATRPPTSPTLPRPDRRRPGYIYDQERNR